MVQTLLVQTMRSAPTTVTRRILENVLGLVSPSPVGLAIEKDVNPSPPSPRPAKFGPLATKIEQFIARAILVIVSTLVEWIDAVWRNPCSDLTARSIAASKHLKIAVRITSSQYGASADKAIDAYRLAALVVDEM